jgi:steroid delta-isomerase-like uncharacterized protein
VGDLRGGVVTKAHASQNEAVVRRFYDELWNDWNLAVADEILAPDLCFRGSLGASSVGIDGFKDYFEQARTVFPDLRAQVDELIVAGDVVVARLTWSATHAGEIFGVPSTGRRWSYVGVGIFHLDAGQIRGAWIVGDTQELWRALGVAPPLS